MHVLVLLSVFRNSLKELMYKQETKFYVFHLSQYLHYGFYFLLINP